MIGTEMVVGDQKFRGARRGKQNNHEKMLRNAVPGCQKLRDGLGAWWGESMGHVSEVASNAWDFARVIVGGELGHILGSRCLCVIERVVNQTLNNGTAQF